MGSIASAARSAVSTKNTAPTISDDTTTWMRSLAPVLRKRSIWFTSSFISAISRPLRSRSIRAGGSFCTWP